MHNVAADLVTNCSERSAISAGRCSTCTQLLRQDTENNKKALLLIPH
jgi:hypothetical protein